MITLKTEALKIPFVQAFAHAAASRRETCSVLTTATLNGKVGYGEGCPRPYVTGETIESALAFHEQHSPALRSINSLTDLQVWIAEHRKQIDANPAAFCALELAILDVLSCDRNQSIEEFLGLPNICGSFTYTAVIGLGSLKTFHQQVTQYQQTGFKDFKLKISGNLSEDLPRLKKIQAIGRVRLDANNLWTNMEDCIAYIQALPKPIFAIEEPLSPKDFGGLKHIYCATKVPIILDESFTRQEDFEDLPTGQWIINLRLSKLGGILQSMAIAEAAEHCKIPIIVGAQVGETSLLSRAALTLANAYRKRTIAQEGAFSTYLLQQDPFLPKIQFGKGGTYTFQTEMTRKGFGLTFSNG